MIKRAKGCLGFFVKIFIFFAVISIAFSLMFRLILVDGDSMLPTLHNNEWILVFKTEKIEYGDIILTDTDNEYNLRIIKRAIAFGGDEVDIDFDTGEVFVNGERISQDYAMTDKTSAGDVSFPVVVPEDSVFVLGDNRSNSVDSRYTAVGCIKLDNIIGRVVMTLLPSPAVID